MFCSRMGNGIPITCTATSQKWTGQPIHLAGSKNPLTLVMGSVKTFYFEYNSSEVKTAALYGKIFLVVVAGGAAAAYCFSRSLSYMVSFGIGIGAGVSPFLTSKKEDTEQEDIKE